MPHRAALTNEWARLRLPLQPLEILADGLRQLGLTTPAALSAWLTTLTAGNSRVRLWAYIPPEAQERALEELRVDAILQNTIIRSSATLQAMEEQEAVCGI